MLFYLCILSSLVVSSAAQCCEENIFTGDGKSYWNAEIDGVSHPGLLKPYEDILDISKGVNEVQEVLVILVNGVADVVEVKIETKNIKKITVFGEQKVVTGNTNDWSETSFDVEKKVKEFTIEAKVKKPNAALRRIFVKACMVKGLSEFQCELPKILADIQSLWQANEVDELVDTYYTKDVTRMVRGVTIIRGIEKHRAFLKILVPLRPSIETLVTEVKQLSENRAYTFYENRFLDKDRNVVPKLSVFILWKKKDTWLVDRLAIASDGTD